MYLNFFGLSKAPFHITPDPAFLFLSSAHKEAYASVVYGVEQRKGFIVLTGEVGTGKTTVLRSFLSQLDREACRPIYLFNPEISFEELVRVLLQELGGQARKDASPAYLLHKLYWTLVEEYKQNRNVVLLIDEAQNMPVETMERVRMLSNLETTQDKLLQIVFVGQPELDDKLNLQELRQLSQRIAIRAALRPLTAEESVEYIHHRAEIAGARAGSIFSKAAIASIVQEAQGSPRKLNILCDNALIAGFGNDERPISAKLAKEVIADYRGHRRSARPRRLLWAAAAGVVVAAGAVLSFLVPGEAAMPTPQETQAQVDVAAAAPAPTAVPAPVPTPPAIDTVAPAAVQAATTVELPPVAALNEMAAQTVDARVSSDPEAPTVEATPEDMPHVTDVAAPVQNVAPEPAVEEHAPAPAPQPALAAATAPVDTSPEAVATVAVADVGSASPEVASPDAEGQGTAGASSTYAVQEGEYLTEILVKHYGEASKSLRDKVLAANPQIIDEDVIIVGEELVLPAWEAAERGALLDGDLQ